MIQSRLQAELANLTASAQEAYPGAQLAVAVLDSTDRLIAGVNPAAPQEAYSLGKLIISLARQRLGIGLGDRQQITGDDWREGGPLADFENHIVTISEAESEALIVSGNTGPQIVARACGGAARVNSVLGPEFTVSGLRTPDGERFDSNTPPQRYEHGLTTAEEIAGLFALLLRESPTAKMALSLSKDTSGLRRNIDALWGDHFRGPNYQHPADELADKIKRLAAASATGQELREVLDRLLYPTWSPSTFPSKAGIYDNPETRTSSRHDVARIGNYIAAVLTVYPYDPAKPTFDLGKDHPGLLFQAAVGEAVNNA